MIWQKGYTRDAHKPLRICDLIGSKLNGVNWIVFYFEKRNLEEIQNVTVIGVKLQIIVLKLKMIELKLEIIKLKL